jgi:DNA-binding IclR family transcriptional regulator
MLDAIRARPGASMSDVARAIGRHPATVWTSVHLLASAGLLWAERDGRAVRLFPSGGLSPRDRLLAKLGSSAAVFEAIERGVPGRPVPIAHACGTTGHAARSHLNRLRRLGALRQIVVEVTVTESRFVAT